MKPSPPSTPSPKRRAIWIAAYFSLGIFSARALPAHWWPALIAIGACTPLITLLASALSARFRFLPFIARACFGLSIVSLAAGYTLLRTESVPADSLARFLAPEPRLVTIEGIITSAPQSKSPHHGPFARFGYPGRITRFTLDAHALIDPSGTRRPVSGALWVRIDQETTRKALGDIIRITGFAAALSPPRNPGESDIRPLARQSAIVGGLRAASEELIAPIDKPPAISLALRARWLSFVRSLHDRAQAFLLTEFPGASDHNPADQLLAALILGRREFRGDDHELSDSFARTGLAHVLAISGMHLAVLAAFLIFAVRITGDRPILEAIVTLALVSIYLIIVPVRAPIFRAAAMIFAFLIPDLFHRRYDRVSLLAWAFILVLVARPLDLFAPGCQLSFLVVAALLILAPRLRDRLWPFRPLTDQLTFLGRAAERAKDTLCITIAAWLIATPLVMYHFGFISPLAVLTSLIAVPIATLLMLLAYAALFIGALVPSFASVTTAPARALADLLISVIAWFDNLPLVAIYAPPVGALWTVFATCAISWILWSHTLRRRTILVLLALTAAWPIARTFLPAIDRSTVLRIDSLAVGDGSCHLIRCGRSTILYDCGSDFLAIGQRAIPDALRALGIHRIPTIIISHPNIDHFSGLLDILRPFSVRRILITQSFIDSARADSGSAHAFLLAELRAQNIEIQTVAAPHEFSLGDCRINMLSPAPQDSFSRANDSSIVLRITAPTTAGDRTFLFLGDIERDAMRTLLARHPDLRADALEAPHHGSARPEAFAFVESVNPQYVIQSTGPSRLGDERWDEVKQNRTWLSTAESGAASLIIRRDGQIDARTFQSDSSGGALSTVGSRSSSPR